MQNLSRKALLFPQQSQQKMFGANVAVRQALGLFRGISQNPLAFVAERKINRSRDLLSNRGVTFNLLTDGFNRSVRTKESIRQGFIFAQEPQQQMLSLDVRRPELACFVARKEDDAPGFLVITFKHNALPPDVPAEEALGLLNPTENLFRSCSCPESGCCRTHYAIKLPPNPSTQTFL